MPSKKRKYNARFPAGRIKKIMQTDEEVGKVAQAVPIIISRTLELFVESLLSKALQVTMARNAKTLSPSHVKQCILAESRFDFLRDLVKNIPDVSAAEEKEMMSAESSPNSSRFPDAPPPPRRVVREDSNSSSSSDIRVPPPPSKDVFKRAVSSETELPHRPHRTEVTSTIVSTDAAIDLTKRQERPVRTANFYQETLPDEVQHRSVITVNPTYGSPQPSTSYTNLTNVPHVPNVSNSPIVPPKRPSLPESPLPVQRIEIAVPKQEFLYSIDMQNTGVPPLPPAPPRTPVTPILNIDFSKNLAQPEIKVLDTSVAGMVSVKEAKSLKRQNSKQHKSENRKVEIKPVVSQPVDIDHLNSGNLQIDEDYDT